MHPLGVVMSLLALLTLVPPTVATYRHSHFVIRKAASYRRSTVETVRYSYKNIVNSVIPPYSPPNCLKSITNFLERLSTVNFP
jgi:hypothetical protein